MIKPKPPSEIDGDALQPIVEALEAAVDRRTYGKIDFYEPYPKQREFYALGVAKRERMLRGGNRNGKTDAGAVEVGYHMTGNYPDWWTGRRFDGPVRVWICGESSVSVRDTQQRKLCGDPGVVKAFGSGYIPRDMFADKPSLSRGVTDAYDTIQVKHVSGGVSTGTFKSYEQGRLKFQSESVHVVWLDEEADMDIYSECLARIADTDGMLFVTFTPLKGRTPLVDRFLGETAPDRGEVNITIYDALHFTPEQRQKIVDGYPTHEREARAMGTPMRGEGRVFQGITDDAITEATLEYLPPAWVKIWGIDFGITHAFAAVLLAWDRDNDVVHVLHTIRLKDQLPLQHATAIKGIGRAVPVAWPHDGHVRDKGSGESLSVLYKNQGLAMLPTHATFPDGSMSTETGVAEMAERMTQGRLKVARQLSDWLEEFREYHRKDGLIVKLRDDLMSATRIGLMMKRFARTVPLGAGKPVRQQGTIADGVEFDVFA